MKKRVFYLLLLTSMAFACTNKQTGQPEVQIQDIIEVQNAKVYITARDTELRLSETETVQFKEYGQALETQAFVLIDPKAKFQTMVGIGSSLTDAAAETF